METGLSNRTTRSIQRALAAAAGAAVLLLAGTAQAALQDRDLDGDTVVDAFYDTDLDITWLRNADVNGQMDWDTAVAWADGFSFAGYDDWRLPLPTADFCFGYGCLGEMGHLLHFELGNPVYGPLQNTGNFQNLQSDYYWLDTAFDSDNAWIFQTFAIYQGVGWKGYQFYAIAVRPGDVPVVPEPGTYALLLAGLAALTLARRQRLR